MNKHISQLKENDQVSITIYSKYCLKLNLNGTSSIEIKNFNSRSSFITRIFGSVVKNDVENNEISLRAVEYQDQMDTVPNSSVSFFAVIPYNKIENIQEFLVGYQPAQYPGDGFGFPPTYYSGFIRKKSRFVIINL